MLDIRSVADLEVGDIGFACIAGDVGAGVTLGQALIDVVGVLRGRRAEQAWFTHAYIVTAKRPYAVEILEARPGGALPARLVGTQRIGPGYGYARLPLTVAQRSLVAAQADALIGTPYSFLDYLSIAALHLGIPRGWVAGRVRDSAHMICSQLVDNLLTTSGVSVFDDGRLAQDVTPGALFHRAGAIGEAVWW